MMSTPASTSATHRLDRALDVGEADRQVADERGAALARGTGAAPTRRRCTVVVTASASSTQAEPRGGGVHVLVAAAGQVDQDHGVGAELAADLQRAGQRVRRLDAPG